MTCHCDKFSFVKLLLLSEMPDDPGQFVSLFSNCFEVMASSNSTYSVNQSLRFLESSLQRRTSKRLHNLALRRHIPLVMMVVAIKVLEMMSVVVLMVVAMTIIMMMATTMS